MDATPNPVAGMTKEELWAHAESATLAELVAFKQQLLDYGWTAEGQLVTRVTERIAELGG